ncbi:predicted NBD/HSP70 family sugar kinase [Jatrophihabitans sp. GAS493]|uniref:ROK family transcriptional regulator n=1 Tax=Jatrophihabitans sp. GAS493 TaxID=1907575 RepID=UPI000BB6F113|nr:ROK family transcriptional regulator [Jatrophihabitans sp. GAS493]SOD73589.1 predicted NBD/HSP70 family sugar kinase [Jatrophihabitans sp. GAS493]
MTSATDNVSPRDRTREDLYQLVRNGNEVTRSELAQLAGLSRSTVNHAVGRLLAEGRIVEAEARTKGRGSGSGRPGVSLSAVASGAPVAGIDFGHSHVTVAVADRLGRELGRGHLVLDVDLNARDAMDFAAETMRQLREEHSIDHLSSVVAGVPGPIDSRTGTVRSPTILMSWVGLAPGQELQARLGVPVHIENDAVLGAYGEQQAGAGRHHSDFLYVKASDGIGASMVLNGRSYTGANGLAGEIGHTKLPGRTELCRCGDLGCLEAVISVKAVREQIAHTHPSSDQQKVQIHEFQDAVTDRILNEAGRTLGRPLAELCNLLNPSALIIGGELGAAGKALIDGVEASVRRHAQPATAANIEILAAELSVRAELTGAIRLAAELASR